MFVGACYKVAMCQAVAVKDVGSSALQPVVVWPEVSSSGVQVFASLSRPQSCLIAGKQSCNLCLPLGHKMKL